MLLLIQPPANTPGKAMEDGPSIWDPASYVGDLYEITDFGLAQPSHGGHVENGPTAGKSLSLSP